MKQLIRLLPRGQSTNPRAAERRLWIMAQDQAAPKMLAPIIAMLNDWDDPPQLDISASATTHTTLAALVDDAPHLVAQITISSPKTGLDTCGLARLGLWCDPKPSFDVFPPCPMVWIGAEEKSPLKPQPWWRQFGPARPSFARQMHIIQPATATAADAFGTQGISADALLPAGDISLAVVPTPVADDLRSAIKTKIGNRPVIFAQTPKPTEIPLILSAFKNLLRSSHRALLSICCDTDLMPLLVEHANGIDFRISQGVDALTQDHNLMIARAQDSLIWASIASATLLGGSFDQNGAAQIDPMPAICAGSVLVHGANLGEWAGQIRRINRAGGTRNVLTQAQLCSAMIDSLSPDKAAQISSVAWTAIGAGANAANQLDQTLARMINQRAHP